MVTWLQKRHTGRKCVASLLLIIISVLLGRLLNLRFELLDIDSLRIGFGDLPILLGSLWLGPWWGMLIGGGSDLLGFALHPLDQYIPMITFIAMLRGFLPGFLVPYTGPSNKVRNLAIQIGVTQVLCSIFLMSLVLYQSLGIPLLESLGQRSLSQLFTIPFYGIIYLFIEQWRTREKLKNSEERYRSIMEVSNTGTWEYQRNTGQVWCNREYFTMLGYDREDFDLSKAGTLEEIWNSFLHPRNREEAVKTFQDYIQSPNGVYENVFPMQHRDGHWVWILSRGQTLEDEDGTPSDVTVGIHIDITEEKEKEQELQLTQFSMDEADLLIFRVTPQGVIEYVNKLACEKLGYSQAELTGRQSTLFIPSSQYIDWQKFWHTLKEEGSVSYERDMVTKEGTGFPVRLISRYFQYGDKEYELAFGQDITIQKETEQKLYAQLEFETMVSQISSFFVRLSVREIDAGIQYALQEIGEFFQVDRSYVLEYSPDGKKISCTYEWCAPNILPAMDLSQDIELAQHPWFKEELENSTYIHIPDVQKLPASAGKEFLQAQDIQSFLLLPMIQGEELLGFMGFDFVKEKKVFSEDQIMLLQVVAEVIANAFKRHAAEKTIQNLTYHDSLTGLYNRLYLEKAIQEMDKEGFLPLSIIMVDLNGLKLINDTYGHFAGDAMLKETATVLEMVCGEEGVIARWGGDEFVILLPRTAEEQARDLCQDSIQKAGQITIQGVPISISLGLGCRNTGDVSLEEILKEAENNMYKHKLTESRSAKNAALEALLQTLAAKSYETSAHTRRMQEVAIQIGQTLNLPHSELSRLELLITLHDIGKINITEDILTKGGPLNDEEWAMVKKHPEIGYRIAQAMPEFAHVAQEILCHHEYWDGSGYPQGLQGEEIPLLARITAIADAYEVMSNGRPYKRPMGQKAIVEEFQRCGGKQFDPQLTAIFLEILQAGIEAR